MFVFFFFFSSRRRHTRYWRDWSSDVCSSDLALSNITSISETDVEEIQRILDAAEEYGTEIDPSAATVNGWLMGMVIADSRSEERRVGKECRSRWSPYH